jgi:FkbM family methyltransferase
MRPISLAREEHVLETEYRDTLTGSSEESLDRAWWQKPTAYKWHSIRGHIRRAWNRAFPRVPLFLRLAPGIWWIALNDAVSDQLFTGFELNERRFVCRFLTAGMTVLDIGAHAGLYTMTASKLVGPSGCVISFEPSPRERQRLKRHLWLNRCRNVTVQPFALGEDESEAELFVVDGSETGCNSFRPAAGIAGHGLRVPVRRLDDCLAQGMFTTVDFIKMDIEGAELSALRGAESVFRVARPVLLCEIDEARVAPWGYRGREIIDLLSGWRYQWFSIGPNVELAELPAGQEQFHGNYVALPVERAPELIRPRS